MKPHAFYITLSFYLWYACLFNVSIQSLFIDVSSVILASREAGWLVDIPAFLVLVFDIHCWWWCKLLSVAGVGEHSVWYLLLHCTLFLLFIFILLLLYSVDLYTFHYSIRFCCYILHLHCYIHYHFIVLMVTHTLMLLLHSFWCIVYIITLLFVVRCTLLFCVR